MSKGYVAVMKMIISAASTALNYSKASMQQYTEDGTKDEKSQMIESSLAYPPDMPTIPAPAPAMSLIVGVNFPSPYVSLLWADKYLVSEIKYSAMYYMLLVPEKDQ